MSTLLQTYRSLPYRLRRISGGRHICAAQILGALLCLLPFRQADAFTIVQSVGNYASSVTTSLSVSITPTTGDELWIYGYGIGSMTFSSGSVDTITVIGSETNANAQAYVASSLGTAETITISGTGASTVCLLVVEVSGLAGAAPEVSTNGTAGTNNSSSPYTNTGPSVGPINTVKALLFDFVLDSSAGKVITGPGTGFTAISPTWTVSPPAGQVQAMYQEVTTAGSSVSPVVNTSNHFDTIYHTAAVFAESGTGGSPNPSQFFLNAIQ